MAVTSCCYILAVMQDGKEQGSYASGKFKFIQGQGIVREFYVVSGKNECFLKCQGNVMEFTISSLYQMMRNRK